MTGPHHLRPQDRADFEAILDLALSTMDTGVPLLDGSTRHSTAQLRADAPDAADVHPFRSLVLEFRVLASVAGPTSKTRKTSIRMPSSTQPARAHGSGAVARDWMRRDAPCRSVTSPSAASE